MPMSIGVDSRIERIAIVAQPFADIIDALPRSVTQQHLEDLKDVYSAKDHPDFERQTYSTPNLFRVRARPLFYLPFRLAMGTHRSTDTEFDIDAVQSTFETYVNARPLMRTEGDERVRMRRRAESALGGAIVLAVVEDGVVDIGDTIRYLRREKLLSRTGARTLASTTSLLTRP